MSEITVAIKEKILNLERTLVEKDPLMPNLLAEIHKTLRQYPENVTLLSDDEINIIVKGLSERQGIELAPKAKEKAPAKSSKTDAKSTLARLKASLATTKTSNGQADIDI
jgi:hypothetical protein